MFSHPKCHIQNLEMEDCRKCDIIALGYLSTDGVRVVVFTLLREYTHITKIGPWDKIVLENESSDRKDIISV